MLMVLPSAWMTAWTGSEAPSGSATPSAVEWSNIGNTEGYACYADDVRLWKADEAVTMSDLFVYETAQTEDGRTALSKVTAREYACQNQKSQPVKTTWYTGQMGSGTVARTSGATGQLTTGAAGTATAVLMKIACGQ